MRKKIVFEWIEENGRSGYWVIIKEEHLSKWITYKHIFEKMVNYNGFLTEC